MDEKRIKKNLNFKRLAESRMNKVLQSLNNLSKLSNRQNYEYNQIEVKQIINTLKTEVNNIEKQFKIHSKEKIFKFNERKQ